MSIEVTPASASIGSCSSREADDERGERDVADVDDMVPDAPENID